MDIIVSRQNAVVKQLAKLISQRRERSQSALCVLDGAHLVRAALDANWKLARCFIAASASEKPEIAQLLTHWGGNPVVLSDTLFSQVTELDSPSGILAIVPIPIPPAPAKHGCVLLLDGIQDPGNVGALLRTAAAAGVNQVWLNDACADVWSPKVLRAAMGAHFVLPTLERIPLLSTLTHFAGRAAVTVMQSSQSVFSANLRGDLALIMGSEGQGVSPELMQRADIRLHIPMANGVESLNVGAAAAICLFERVRQLE